MTFTIKLARLHANLTQEQMAKEFGVCRDTYRKIEAHPDTCTIAQAKRLSQVSKIPLDQIFFGDNSTLSRK